MVDESAMQDRVGDGEPGVGSGTQLVVFAAKGKVAISEILDAVPNAADQVVTTSRDVDARWRAALGLEPAEEPAAGPLGTFDNAETIATEWRAEIIHELDRIDTYGRANLDAKTYSAFSPYVGALRTAADHLVAMCQAFDATLARDLDSVAASGGTQSG
jgi:hypothetical protein